MKLILAPMANLTHSGLRMLIHCFADPDEYFTEMIHAPSLVSGGNFEQWYLRVQPAVEKLVWQLTSHKTDAFVNAVPLVLRHGGIGIDLNMGCCAPSIVQSGAGFAWRLKPPTETAKMVKRVKDAITRYVMCNNIQKHIRLSVKLRLGQAEDYSNLLQFCRMLISEGVELITLHPRLQRQGFGRPAMHEYTARLAQDMSIPVYGNGDIDSYATLQKIHSCYPCSGWMIGRAAIKKPWIFKAVKETSVYKKAPQANKSNPIEDSFPPQLQENQDYIDLLDTAHKFLEFLQTEQPPEFHRTRAQRFFQFFSDNFCFANYCKGKLLQAKNIDIMEQILSNYFQEVPTDRFIKKYSYL